MKTFEGYLLEEFSLTPSAESNGEDLAIKFFSEELLNFGEVKVTKFSRSLFSSVQKRLVLGKNDLSHSKFSSFFHDSNYLVCSISNTGLFDKLVSGFNFERRAEFSDFFELSSEFKTQGVAVEEADLPYPDSIIVFHDAFNIFRVRQVAK